MKKLSSMLLCAMLSATAFAQDAQPCFSIQSTAIDALVPAIGFRPGNPNATQDAIGPTGIAIPGRCPPTQAELNAQVQRKGQFPTGLDLESRIRRYEITLSAIQDLRCPASSTTLLPRLNSLTALRGNPNAAYILSRLAINQTPAG